MHVHFMLFIEGCILLNTCHICFCWGFLLTLPGRTGSCASTEVDFFFVAQNFCIPLSMIAVL